MKLRKRMFRDAGDEGRESANHGHEFRVDDGLAAVLFVKGVGALQMLLLEEAGIGAVEDGRTGAAAEQVSTPVPRQTGGGQQYDHDEEIELAGARHHSDGEEQRISRQYETHQESRFGEYDGGQRGITQPAGQRGRKQMDQPLGRGERPQEIQQGMQHAGCRLAAILRD